MSLDLSSPESFQKSWVTQPRPLFIVDECRAKKQGGGEFVLFVFAQTDTLSAVQWATEAESIKSRMTEKTLPKVLKGSDLFGNKQQKFHEPYRQYIKSKLKACEQISFLLIDNTLLPAIVATAPSKIKLTDQDLTKEPSKVEGRELSPFLNCIKTIVCDRNMPHPVIDVLVDRSFQLGLDPSSRKINRDQFQLIGPGQLSPKLKNEFLFVSTREEGGFSDLLVIPDSLAYILLHVDSSYVDSRKKIVHDTGQLYYWHDTFGNLPAFISR